MENNLNAALVIAAQAFIATMRREWFLQNKNIDAQCPVLNLSEYSMSQRNALIRSIGNAIEAAKPDNVAKVMERQQ